MYCHKYFPKKLDDILYHKNIRDRLKNLSKNTNINNMLFAGLEGTGKKTLCYAYLNELYGSQIYDIKTSIIKDNIKDIKYFHSNVHIDLDLNIYKSNEKTVVFNFIKEYSSTINISNNSYKIIIFRNAEKISYTVYCMLRRILELNYNTTRYIFISNNVSSLPGPIRSRLLIFRLPIIKTKEGLKVLKHLCKKEEIKYSLMECKKIIKRSYDIKKYINLYDMINFFELCYLNDKKYKKIYHTEHDKLDFLVRLIRKKNISLLQFQKIREVIIDKYIECYEIKNIMKYINEKLLDDDTIDDSIKFKMVELIASKEYELLKSNKHVIILENYITNLILLLNITP
jgi:DNA polymerase III delta prime subunit